MPHNTSGVVTSWFVADSLQSILCVLFQFAKEGDLELVSDKQQLETQSGSE